MSKFLRVLVAAMIIMSFAGAACADDNMLTKLGRGVANVFTSPLEIPKDIGQTSRDDGPMAGFTVGVLKGVFNTVKRAVVGAFEIVSFPIPVPADYAPILDDPEYFLKSDTDVPY